MFGKKRIVSVLKGEIKAPAYSRHDITVSFLDGTSAVVRVGCKNFALNAEDVPDALADYFANAEEYQQANQPRDLNACCEAPMQPQAAQVGRRLD